MVTLLAQAVLVSVNCVTSTPVRGEAPSLLPASVGLTMSCHDAFVVDFVRIYASIENKE